LDDDDVGDQDEHQQRERYRYYELDGQETIVGLQLLVCQP
jgi:hypothetical protein